jgi:hypothetical protein
MILSLGLGRSIKWGKSCSCSMEQRACWSIHHSQVEQHWPWCIGCCRRSWSVDSKHAFYFLVLFLPYHNIIISEMQKWTLFFFHAFFVACDFAFVCRMQLHHRCKDSWRRQWVLMLARCMCWPQSSSVACTNKKKYVTVPKDSCRTFMKGCYIVVTFMKELVSEPYSLVKNCVDVAH